MEPNPFTYQRTYWVTVSLDPLKHPYTKKICIRTSDIGFLTKDENDQAVLHLGEGVRNNKVYQTNVSFDDAKKALRIVPSDD